jgi:toxin ParE1/3/4
VSEARVDFAPQALQEIDDAFEWYLGRSVHAAEAFIREVESAVALIGSSPGLWPRSEAGTRRYVLRTFPYSIIYREIPADTSQEAAAVLAVAIFVMLANGRALELDAGSGVLQVDLSSS